MTENEQHATLKPQWYEIVIFVMKIAERVEVIVLQQLSDTRA